MVRTFITDWLMRKNTSPSDPCAVPGPGPSAHHPHVKSAIHATMLQKAARLTVPGKTRKEVKENKGILPSKTIKTISKPRSL
jgi:hypothetical protein